MYIAKRKLYRTLAKTAVYFSLICLMENFLYFTIKVNAKHTKLIKHRKTKLVKILCLG